MKKCILPPPLSSPHWHTPPLFLPFRYFSVNPPFLSLSFAHFLALSHSFNSCFLSPPTTSHTYTPESFPLLPITYYLPSPEIGRTTFVFFLCFSFACQTLLLVMSSCKEALSLYSAMRGTPEKCRPWIVPALDWPPQIACLFTNFLFLGGAFSFFKPKTSA